MEIKHIEYFLAVARYGSFTKAAQNLYVTQPTISKMIKNLEDELGVALFVRTGKEIELTDAGRAILGQARIISNAVRDMSSELNDLMHLVRGCINIGLAPMIGSSFFPQVISKFLKQYPDVSIQLTEKGALKIEDDVAAGLLDIGVTLMPVNERLFEWFPLMTENLKALLHSSHPLSGQERISLAELSAESFISLNKEFILHDRIIEECINTGFKPNIIAESSQWDMIGGMVAAKLGVALLPATICRKISNLPVKAVPLQEAIPWNLAVISRRGQYLSFAARRWLEFLQAFLREGDNPAG